jgi:hypothetical protein
MNIAQATLMGDVINLFNKGSADSRFGDLVKLPVLSLNSEPQCSNRANGFAQQTSSCTLVQMLEWFMRQLEHSSFEAGTYLFNAHHA